MNKFFAEKKCVIFFLSYVRGQDKNRNWLIFLERNTIVITFSCQDILLTTGYTKKRDKIHVFQKQLILTMIQGTIY